MCKVNMKQINLAGEWYLSGGDYNRISAQVPGCVHTDLLSANLIEDPYFRDNEKKLQWIGETDWTYERDFIADKDVLLKDYIILRCEGLDTLAEIYINGNLAGKTDNMFRTWEFDIKKFLLPGKNNIRIIFRSTIPYIRQKAVKRKLWLSGVGLHRIDDSNQIRKMQCNYGWDWGPMLVTCGIWKDIEIQAYDEFKIEQVHLVQNHHSGQVILQASVELSRKPLKPVMVELNIYFEDEKVCENVWVMESGISSIETEIPNPRLWWPNNIGPQNLYRVTLKVYRDTDIFGQVEKTIGLRTIQLVRKPDEWGESFYFEVNGVPFFAKGANWIPADTFVTRISNEFYEQLIKDAVEANMNMLRVWGGGIYEYDAFYDLCDKYGICVWQDLMFSCAAYPAYDPEYMANVEAEVIDNIRNIRHHACLALLCGNNEMEQVLAWIDYDKSKDGMTLEEYESLFDVLLPGIVREYAPYISWWPASPHTPGNRPDFNNPQLGDAHLWGVWHGREPFEWYRKCEHRFNSEFGFQSFPDPKIVREYTLPEDRNISSYIMEYHQRSVIGNDAIMQYMLSWFKLPFSFDYQLYLSQILQGEAMRYAVEHWRRSMPRGMGTLYWQINDCWPCPSWSSIDYRGGWKALHYHAKKFFAPVLVSGVEDITNGTVQIYLNNDYLRDISGTVSWRILHTDGSILQDGETQASISHNSVQMVYILDLRKILEHHGERNLLVHIEFSGEYGIQSDNIVLFTRPKHLNLEKPKFTMSYKKSGDNQTVLTVTTDKPALWVWTEGIDDDVRYSDRFFHLMPGTEKQISIETKNNHTTEQIEKQIKLCSLYDTYQA